MTTKNADGLEVTQALIANILNTRFEDIGHDVVDCAKKRILDMIGDALAGAKGDGNLALLELVGGSGGKNKATVLGYGNTGPIRDVAFVNCIFGRSFDRGPLTYVYHDQRSPNHITETSALTALAAGESKGISGKELIASLVVGDDLAARIHLSVDRAQPGQALPPGTPPPPPARGSEEAFAAAAVTGRILGLSAEQLKNAFGIATMLTGGGAGSGMANPGAYAANRAPAKSPVSATQVISGLTPGWEGIKDPTFIAAMERAKTMDNEKLVNTKLGNGLSARAGVNAVELARGGWPGVRDPFFGQNGGHFPTGLMSTHHPDMFTGTLGKEYITEVCFKPHPGGNPTQAPNSAALALAQKHDINTDDIAEVVLHLSAQATAAHYATPYMIGAYPTMNALWSYYFVVASALYRKSVTAENFTEKKIRDPKLQALVAKVKLGYLDKPEGVEVEVIMKDGRRFSEYYRKALGDPSNPVSREGLLAKFREQVEFSQLVDKKAMEELINLVENLEQVKDITMITKLAAKRM